MRNLEVRLRECNARLDNVGALEREYVELVPRRERLEGELAKDRAPDWWRRFKNRVRAFFRRPTGNNSPLVLVVCVHDGLPDKLTLELQSNGWSSPSSCFCCCSSRPMRSS